VEKALEKRGWEKAAEGSSEWDMQWLVVASAVEYDLLKPSQIVNHFNGAARSLTTKRGLLNSLREAHWVCDASVSRWFPRSYDLSELDGIRCFQVDFRWSAAEAVLRQFLVLVDDMNPSSLWSNENPIKSSSSVLPPRNIIHNSIKVAVQKLGWLTQLREEGAPEEATELPVDMDDRDWEGILSHACGLPTSDQLEEKEEEEEEDARRSLENLQTKAKEVLDQIEACSWWPQTYLDGKENLWILKPAGKSRGRGIVVFNSLIAAEAHLSGTSHRTRAQFHCLKAEARMMARLETGSDPHIVQRYIEEPLLIHERKFDIRH